MKMYNISRRDRFYNQGSWYAALGGYRVPVVPGQSVSIKVNVKFQTAAFLNNALCGGITSMFLFYVPNRLLWDDWTEFISQADGFAGTVPRSTTLFPNMFDRNSSGGYDGFNVLPRRAFKLSYNEYFGNEDFSSSAPSWYADVTDDSVNTVPYCRNTEQFTSRLMVEGALAEPTYDATTVPIPLNDFYRQMMSARSARKAQMTGDKYVDTLRRMGVEPDWRIQNAPEFLGRCDMHMRPVKTFDTSSTSTGSSVARFEGTLECNTGKKMFAEHGYVIGIFTSRPHIFNSGLGAPIDFAMENIEDFYLADNMRSQDTYNDGVITSAVGPDIYSQRFGVYRNGVHAYGLGSDWATWYGTPSDVDAVVYPQGTWFSTGDELGGDAVAFVCEAHMVGSSPIPPNSF